MPLHFPGHGINCYAKTCYCRESELTFFDFSCLSNRIAVVHFAINLKAVRRIPHDVFLFFRYIGLRFPRKYVFFERKHEKLWKFQTIMFLSLLKARDNYRFFFSSATILFDKVTNVKVLYARFPRRGGETYRAIFFRSKGAQNRVTRKSIAPGNHRVRVSSR